MKWRLVGNLAIVCFSLVAIGILTARGVVENNGLYIVGAVATSLVAAVNLFIAIQRIKGQIR